ncbi:hypothetical protein VK86_14880 [Moellerella wisconsensis]|nr:hypothetical protein VK86_14880 [Moellerella wisconsensis]
MQIFNNLSLWYRPAWQLNIIIMIFIVFISIGYYLFFWHSHRETINRLHIEMQQKKFLLQRDADAIHQLPTTQQFNSQNEQLKRRLQTQPIKAIELMYLLKIPLDKSGVTINHWRPISTAENQYYLEVSGDYFQIINFLELVVQALPTLILDKLLLQPKKGELFGLFTLTLFKDEKNNASEQ